MNLESILDIPWTPPPLNKLTECGAQGGPHVIKPPTLTHLTQAILTLIPDSRVVASQLTTKVRALFDSLLE